MSSDRIDALELMQRVRQLMEDARYAGRGYEWFAESPESPLTAEEQALLERHGQRAGEDMIRLELERALLNQERRREAVLQADDERRKEEGSYLRSDDPEEDAEIAEHRIRACIKVERHRQSDPLRKDDTWYVVSWDSPLVRSRSASSATQPTTTEQSRNGA
jgi:hypothetical protein